MRHSIALRIICTVAVAQCLFAQPPAVPKETQGLPARATPADYLAQAKVGIVTIAADFTGHGIPNAEAALNSEDFVAVEVAFFGAPDSRLTITATDFSLRINGKKEALPSQPWGLAAKNIKDPEWVPPDFSADKKGGSGLSAGGSGGAGNPPPVPAKPPVELLRGWQQRVRRAAIAEGDRPLPQAGLVFFQYRGKAEGIRSVELLYDGPAGKASLTLQQP